eukprot:888810_1
MAMAATPTVESLSEFNTRQQACLETFDGFISSPPKDKKVLETAEFLRDIIQIQTLYIAKKLDKKGELATEMIKKMIGVFDTHYDDGGTIKDIFDSAQYQEIKEKGTPSKTG